MQAPQRILFDFHLIFLYYSFFLIYPMDLEMCRLILASSNHYYYVVDLTSFSRYLISALISNHYDCSFYYVLVLIVRARFYSACLELIVQVLKTIYQNLILFDSSINSNYSYFTICSIILLNHSRASLILSLCSANLLGAVCAIHLFDLPFDRVRFWAWSHLQIRLLVLSLLKASC